MGSSLEVGKLPSGSSKFGGTETAKLRVLIADDNEDARTTVRMLLQVFGHESYQAADGFEAVAAAEATQPDVVLMDLGMPGMDGCEAARIIRRSSWGADVVLVAQTGRDDEEVRQRTIEAGFDYHLVKPVEPAKLRELLAEFAACNKRTGKMANVAR
jgi:CheY-like chemotaxis protein